MTHFVLDLGTNTFHLLIVQEHAGEWSEVFRERQYVFLGESGFDPISESAVKRAEQTLRYFTECIKKHECVDGVILATEGLRKASNSPALLKSWDQFLPKPIQLISGKEEAELVGRGVILAAAPRAITGWAVDIGGGSLEVIEIHEGKIMHLHSMPLGLSVLREWYRDKNGKERFSLIRNRLKDEIMRELTQFHISDSSALIGVAGSFELLPTDGQYLDTLLRVVQTERIEEMVKTVLDTPINKRHLIPWLPKERSVYIMEAMAIIHAFAGLPFRNILYCPFTLKEGALHKLRQG